MAEQDYGSKKPDGPIEESTKDTKPAVNPKPELEPGQGNKEQGPQENAESRVDDNVASPEPQSEEKRRTPVTCLMFVKLAVPTTVLCRKL